MARTGIVVLAAVALVAAACGSAQPTYTLQAVKAAFASQGIPLRQMFDGYGNSVVLVNKEWSGPIGYQRVGASQSSATQYFVFVGSGPHTQRRGNVFVAYGDGEGATVKAALRRLAVIARNKP